MGLCRKSIFDGIQETKVNKTATSVQGQCIKEHARDIKYLKGAKTSLKFRKNFVVFSFSKCYNYNSNKREMK